MANLSDLDMSNVQAKPARKTMPAGDYQAVIVESEMKVPKSGGAPMLALTLKVQNDPEYNGNTLWDNLCIRHAKPEVVAIAKQRLKQIMDAVGLASISDSQQLHNRLLTVSVAVKPTDDGRLSNEVKGYSPKRSSGQALTQTSYAAPSAGPANPFG